MIQGFLETVVAIQVEVMRPALPTMIQSLKDNFQKKQRDHNANR